MRDAEKKLFDILLVFMFDRLGRKDDESPFILEGFNKIGIENLCNISIGGGGYGMYGYKWDKKQFQKKLKNASASKVVIERPAKNARITIYSSRPGVVIGKKGEDIEVLRRELQKRMGVPVHVNIEEIRKPEVDAQLIADSITQQLEKRIMFRRAMKRAMQSAMRLGA